MLLFVIHLSFFFSRYLDVIEQALACGETVLIENLPEKVDPVLEPVLGRNTTKRGRLVLQIKKITFKKKMDTRSLKPTHQQRILCLGEAFQPGTAAQHKYLKSMFGFYTPVDTQLDMPTTSPHVSALLDTRSRFTRHD